ncbi:MAG: hypothetical protein Q7J33_12395, partial [Serpentinimonas sp.]|nr:hypothetical protein [Serpentinimonas sp.]
KKYPTCFKVAPLARLCVDSERGGFGNADAPAIIPGRGKYRWLSNRVILPSRRNPARLTVSHCQTPFLRKAIYKPLLKLHRYLRSVAGYD